MARQKGFLKLLGSMGDVSFVKTRNGYIAKEKTSITAGRIATDPAFQRTRENLAEFARAAKASRLLRTAFAATIKNSKDRRMVNRLQKLMMKVLQADAVNSRGMRNVIDGEAALLQGFEFNGNAQMTGSFLAPYSCQIDRVNGELSVVIPSYVPANAIQAPAGATHFQLRAAGGWIDFEKGVFQVKTEEAPRALWNGNNVPAGTLQLAIEDQQNHPIFLLLGIEFTQEVNGAFYPLMNGAFNSMAIVLVDADV